MISTELGIAFVMGLLGSTHCVAMCGGLASAFSLRTPLGKLRSRTHLIDVLLYNSGRIFSYTLAGLIAGTLLGFMTQQAGLIITITRNLAGLLLIMMGLYISGYWSGLVHLERLGQGLWKKIKPTAGSLLNPPGAFRLGLVWGWLPCGLVYSTLVWSSMDASPLTSATKMLFFGLGTLPAMVSTALLARQLERALRQRGVRNTAGALLVLYGLWTLPWIQRSLHSIVG